jgi:hypothetical protein
MHNRSIAQTAPQNQDVVGSRAAPDDAAWFSDHPSRQHRLRRAEGAQLWAVRRYNPGLFLRTIVTEPIAPDDEGVAEACWWIPGELAELSAERIEALRSMPYRVVARSRLSEIELRAHAQLRGYKPGWVWHRLEEQRRAS